jgi:hypothetical protein
MSAPAAHFSAPAAHFSAPSAHMSAPTHMAAPHMSSPHFSSARMGNRPMANPHMSTQHMASPHMSTPHMSSRVASHHNTPGITHGANAHNFTHNARSASRITHGTNATNATNGNVTNGVGANAGRLHGNRTAAHTPSTTNGSAVTGSRGGAANAHNHILRNSAFTNVASRDPAARGLANSTFRGRYAQSQFAGRDRDHRHHFGFVVGFVGPLFWPYAYDDFLDYTFWPTAYDTFWPYAYDDVFEGIYGAYAPEYGASYAYAGAPASSSAYARGSGGTAGGGGPQICSGQAQGLTDLPVEQIAREVQPNADQRHLLDDLKAATEKAVGIMQAACPGDLPATPTGRIAAMRQRVDAMLQAVRTVRPALERFYNALSDEQKERFNSLDQNAFANAPQPDVSHLCGQDDKSPAAALPVPRIEQTLHLDASQTANLKELNDATARAGQILSQNCPTAQALTPPGRVAAMEQRLDGMLQSIETVRPALNKFYASLSDEQKAHFDRLSRRQG